MQEMLRDAGSIPGLGKPSGVGHGNQLQYSCMENSMDRGSWQDTVNGVAKSRTRLKQLNMHIHMISWLCLPVVMYGCAGWIIKKAEHEELILLNCGVGEDS